jgi:hypothetical protein
MTAMFFRVIEIAFAAYMVPALLLPLAWIAAWLFRARLAVQSGVSLEADRQSRVLFWAFLSWFGFFFALAAGVPLNRGGRIAEILAWVAYISTNLLIAWFLLRFTATYGSIPAGRTADRVFLRFIGIVAAQPLMTAAAFAVLNNVMGVAWNAQVPELPAIQEGI